MANEILLTAKLAFFKDGEWTSMGVGSMEVNVTTKVYFEGIKTITTSPTSLPQGSTAVGGWIFIKNTDKTNYVEIMDSASVAMFKLLPGEPFIGRTGSGWTYTLKANTASCDVKFLICSP